MPKKINWAGNKEAKFAGVRKNYRDFNWVANAAISDDIPYIRFPDVSGTTEVFLTYRDYELDNIIRFKATKTGPTTNGNIALLDKINLNGDLYDSGVQITDFSINEFDGGIYDNSQEY